MSDVLKKICADKLLRIEARKNVWSLDSLKQEIKNAEKPREFLKNINAKIGAGKFALIAEIKKTSPSKGIIRANFDPVEIAKDYEKGGAACISVLTDEKYFHGRDEYIGLVKSVTNLPVLRKDFMLDPYQIYESRALGGDCILLIMAALEPLRAKELEDIAINLGMDVLLEAHNEKELDCALKMQSRLIGINNRNLKTLQVDINTTLQFAKNIPASYTVVCESGVESNQDVKLMAENGIKCFLVGESLMRQSDIEIAVRNLIQIP